jgi:segregation and condensation protein B
MTDRSISEHECIVEALLFASDHPLSFNTLLSLIDHIDASGLQAVITALRRRYEENGHSFQIIEIAGGFQMCTRPRYARWVKELYHNRTTVRLSRPALETLAIVAYRQPIVRTDIEAIRGVNIEGVLKTLLQRNLITIRGRKKAPGRPLLYGTTDEFLRYFGLNKISDLPTREELKSLIEADEPTEEVVIDHDHPAEQISGPAFGDLPASGGSVHSEGASAGERAAGDTAGTPGG